MADIQYPLLNPDVASANDHSNKYTSLSSHFKSISSDDDHFPRTGTLWTASAHIITAVIGAGVLSLAWSVAQLGWIAGPVGIIIFSLITFNSALMLADCYKDPDPVIGPKRNYTYKDAVKINLGETKSWLCGLVQYVNLYGTGVAYTITTAISMRAIRKSNCYHKYGHDFPCNYSEYSFMVIFGVIQIILSQIPDFAQLWWLSIVAAIMSCSYSTIGLGLSLAKVIDHGKVYGSLGGISLSTTLSTTQKVWRIFQALGDIAFANGFSIVLIEIQDTLKSPPAENMIMKRASLIAIIITTFFYVLCGCFGYAAFGDNAPGNLLTGFGFYEPYWLIDFANACIAVHLIGAYQVFIQPFFAFGEAWFSRNWPNSRFINSQRDINIPLFGFYNVNFFRLCWRTVVVFSTTVIAYLFPYFNNVLGILGAINFWPLTIYFPFEMYIVKNKVPSWSWRWTLLKSFSFICLLVSVVTAIGSIAEIV